jgi:hypothetical protein
MIPVIKVFNAICNYAPEKYFGPNPMPEFNSMLNEVQNDLADMVFPQYDRNERIRTLVTPFVVSSTGSSTSGVISKPNGFYRALSIRITSGGAEIPLSYAKENELIDEIYIPQRKMDINKGIAYYQDYGSTILVLPSGDYPYKMMYLSRPSAANLDFVLGDIGTGEMGLIPSDVVDLAWNENAFSIILHLLRFKYGVGDKDAFLAEVGRLGLGMDLVNQA